MQTTTETAKPARKLRDVIPSTVNAGRLGALQVFNCPPTYHVNKDRGMGCLGDPPGFPSYYLQSVYTQHGNSPRKGAEVVIFGRVVYHSSDWNGCKDWNEVHAKRQARLLKLWNKLPLEHPRTRAWMAATIRHHAHCYQAPESQAAGKWETVIYPVPYYNLKTYTDDPRFSDTYRAATVHEVNTYNDEIKAQTKKIATIDNHEAVILIRRYYPDWTPTENEAAAILDGDVPLGYSTGRGDWWTTEETQPTPEQCQPRSMGPHPINGTWCQFCGWDSREGVSATPWSADEAQQHRASAERVFRHDDPATCREYRDQCGACVLGGYLSASARADGQKPEDGPNYAGWARLYVEAGKEIPKQWAAAFEAQRKSTNTAYAAALGRSIATFGYQFAKH